MTRDFGQRNRICFSISTFNESRSPLKAARAIEYGIEKEFVKDNEKHLKYLAQGWHMAQELDKASLFMKKQQRNQRKANCMFFLVKFI